MFPRHFAGQHLEEDEPVGRLEGVRVMEIDLVLAVGVLMVGLVDAPVELLQGVVHLRQVAGSGGQALEVVTGLDQGIDAGRVPRRDPALRRAPDQEMFRLDTDVERIAGGPQFLEDAAEIDARAVSKWLAIDVKVGGETSQAGFPRQGRVGGRVDASHHVVRRRILAHAPDSAPRETGPLVGHRVQALPGHHLHLGRPMKIDELHQQVSDLVLLQLVFQL